MAVQARSCMAALGRWGLAVPPCSQKSSSFAQLCFAAANEVTLSWHEREGQCPAGGCC